jgi:predicted dehydrogenase
VELDGPVSMVMTVTAGRLPANSWIMDEAEGGGRVISEVCHFIDLMVAVSGSLVSSISGLGLRESGRELQSASFSLGFSDGSIGTIHYFANGSRKVPKERFEVFSDGRTAVIENFRAVQSFGFKGLKSKRLWSQQKGHAVCMDAFLRAVRGEDVVIPSWEEIRNVTRATVLAREALRSGVAFRV